MQNSVLSIIEDTAARFHADRSRIYLYGYSAGGVGCLGLLKVRPDLFAAAVPICGATGADNIKNLEGIPLWLVHAEDDQIVSCSYGSGHLGSRDLFRELAGTFTREETLFAAGDTLRYTELPAGYMTATYSVNPHCSWVYVSDPCRPEIREWLFSNVK